MKKTFKGSIKLDVRDSKSDWTPFELAKAPQGTPVAELMRQGNLEFEIGAFAESLDSRTPLFWVLEMVVVIAASHYFYGIF